MQIIMGRTRLEITYDGFSDAESKAREDWRAEELRCLFDELRMRNYINTGHINCVFKQDPVYICEGCLQEYYKTEYLALCKQCGKDVCVECRHGDLCEDCA